MREQSFSDGKLKGKDNRKARKTRKHNEIENLEPPVTKFRCQLMIRSRLVWTGRERNKETENATVRAAPYAGTVLSPLKRGYSMIERSSV